MKRAALAAVAKHLPRGCESLGIRLDLSPVAATPVAMRVCAQAQLVRVDGRRLTFRFSAEDERALIGEGIHERVVIDGARSERRAKERATGARAAG